jgi:hypothetical protein
LLRLPCSWPSASSTSTMKFAWPRWRSSKRTPAPVPWYGPAMLWPRPLAVVGRPRPEAGRGCSIRIDHGPSASMLNR